MKFVTKLLGTALAVALLTPAFTYAQAKPKTDVKADAKTAPKAAANAPTAKEISDAAAKGMVWVNTNSGVYHKDGQFFGKTKEGQFMTEADAKKAGYRAAKESPIGKKGGSKETSTDDSGSSKKGKPKN